FDQALCEWLAETTYEW
ncbi:unnamed protein product, partial [Rotaria sp. Silwood2]